MGTLLNNRFKVIVILISLIAIITTNSMAQTNDDFVPIFHPTLDVIKTEGKIVIDGQLHDEGWKVAAVVDHFHERDPGDNIKPPVKTKVFMTYDETHLFLAAICYDDPAKIRASLCARDRMGGDNIGFFFDTYGDAAWAYTVNVNPFGVQADALWSNGFGEDNTFDLVFESAGKITDSGYQVELAIPFASLRFPDTEEQTWRMQFWRHHYRDTHYNITWAANDRNEANWVRNWGIITGIKNVRPGKGIELIPAWTGFVAGNLDIMPDSSLDFSNNDPHGELSFSGKYSITSDITLDAAINPDFSNVESDAFQINVNSPTALSYSEKRPFFQEGSDLYKTKMDLVYTRSINEPDYAIKLTARRGRLSVSYLGAHDINSPFLIPFEETSSDLFLGGKSFSNILRVRKTFGTGSQFGLLVTDRAWEGGGRGTTYSTDGTISLSRQITFRGQIVGSYFDEPENSDLTTGLEGVYFDDGKYSAVYDGESFSDLGLSGLLSYRSSDFYISGSYDQLGKSFRADNGWITRNNRRMAQIYSEYTYRFDKGLIEYLNFQLKPMRVWNMDGRIKDEAIFATLWVPFRLYQIGFTYQYLISSEDFGGRYYGNIWNHYLEVSTSPCELISFGLTFNYGDQLAYRYNAIGRQTKWNGWIDLTLFDRIYFENWINYVRSVDNDTDLELFDGFVYGSRLTYQYNRQLSLRVFVQYDDFSKTWDADPLITYQISPFTLFYVGSTYYVQKYDGLDKSGSRLVPEGDPMYSKYKLDSRQFFMKLQYMFQI